MKVVGDFNKISEKIRPKPLAENEMAEYVLLKGKPDPYPGNKGKIIYPAATRINTRMRIKDPEYGFIDIGLVKEVDKDKNIKTEARYFGASGRLGLYGNSNEDVELYEIMELSNENQSNPNRDVTVEAKYRRINVIQDAKNKNTIRDKKIIALTYLGNMKEAEKREFAASMGWDENADLELITDWIGDFADKDSAKFVAFFHDDDMKTKATIKSAMSKGIIKYDPPTHKILWCANDGTIAQLDREEGKNPVELFSEWIKTRGNGLSMFESIKKKMNTSIKEKVSEVTEQL